MPASGRRPSEPRAAPRLTCSVPTPHQQSGEGEALPTAVKWGEVILPFFDFFFSFLPIRRLKRKRGELDLHLFKYSLVTGATQATVGAICSFFYRSRFVDLFSMTFINVLLIFRPFQCSWYRRRQAGRRGHLWAEAGSRPRFNFSQLGRGKPLAPAGRVGGRRL